MEVFDRSAALERLGGDSDRLEELLEDFQVQIPAMMEAIEKAAKRKRAIPSCPRIQTNSRLARRAVSIVIDPWRAPDLGLVGGDVGDSSSPYAQGKHRPATGCHAPGRRPGSRHGPHLDQNVLAGYTPQ